MTPVQPTPPAADRRLGFGLYFAWAMTHHDPGREPGIVVERDAVGEGLLGLLAYCHAHRLGGAA